MQNPFEELSQKLDTVLEKLASLEKEKAPSRLSFSEFCREQGISRPTGYAWAEKGLIRLEKIGGRNFVPTNSISINSRKYFRKEAA